MNKALIGTVVSVNMQKTAIINLTFKSAHPLYKKLMKKDHKLKVDIGQSAPKKGDSVKIIETRPISKTKHFKIMEVLKNGSA